MHANLPPSRRARAGVISILAMLLMASITGAAVGASVIIIGELQQSESLDQAVVTVYAAEAGLEDGLYQVRLQRDKNATLSSTIDTKLIVTPTKNVTTRRTLNNTAKWERTAFSEEQFRVARLSPNEVTTLDIFDPDNAIQSGVESLRIEWDDDCNGFSWIETTMLTWDASSVNFDPATQHVYKDLQACNMTGERCTDIVYNSVGGGDINPLQVYRFSFRALAPTGAAASCSIENLTVTAYDHQDGDPGTNNANIVAIPARITLKSTGLFSRARQALTASVPWRAPISGLLSFVLFSEEDIVK